MENYFKSYKWRIKMRKFLIKIIKKNKFLYNVASYLNRKITKKVSIVPKQIEGNTTYMCYTLKDLSELEKIILHYDTIKKYDSQLVILIKNNKYNLKMHTLIEENPKIIFISHNYIEKYKKQLDFKNFIFIEYNKNNY